MTDFFGPKVKRGRPQKAASKAGRLATKEVPPTTALPQAVLKPAPAPKIKMPRRSWSKGDGLEIMTAAVAAWGEELKKPEADQISMAFFAEQRSIPSAHVTPPNSKRIKLGASVGRKPIIGPDTQAVITDVLIRHDRANQGKGVKEAVDILETMHPELKRKAHPARGLLPAHGAAQVREGPDWARNGASHDNEADRLHCEAAVALAQGKALQASVAQAMSAAAHGPFLVKPNTPCINVPLQ